MTVSLIRILAAAAVCSLVVTAPSAAQTSPPAADTKPVKLKSFMKKPVASSATRTAKTKDGEYAKVAVKRRTKNTRVAAAPPQPAPEIISPAAAQAFAAYELARVRVVTPEEAEGARQFADDAIKMTTVIGVDNVQIVSADEVNDIDRKADSLIAVSLDSLSRDLAGSRNLYTSAEPKAEPESWFQRLLMVFGGAFAGVAALVRVLLG